jgi:hypothetical protein
MVASCHWLPSGLPSPRRKEAAIQLKDHLAEIWALYVRYLCVPGTDPSLEYQAYEMVREDLFSGNYTPESVVDNYTFACE